MALSNILVLLSISDEEPAFMSSFVLNFMQQFAIKLIIASVTNHKTLLAEHGIASLIHS